MNREPVKIIADIISHEMNISPDRIFIYNDGRELPKDDNLYIVLSVMSRPPFGVKSSWKETETGLVEVQTLNVQETIIASAVSKNTDARTRAYEVQMAVNSVFSEKQQELYGCHISMIAPVRDMSFLENTARLNRFDTEITVLAAYQKIKDIDYFNTIQISSKFEQ